MNLSVTIDPRPSVAVSATRPRVVVDRQPGTPETRRSPAPGRMVYVPPTTGHRAGA